MWSSNEMVCGVKVAFLSWDCFSVVRHAYSNDPICSSIRQKIVRHDDLARIVLIYVMALYLIIFLFVMGACVDGLLYVDAVRLDVL